VSGDRGRAGVVLSQGRAQTRTPEPYVPVAAVWNQSLSPRGLRFRKLTQRGPMWFAEAMFPGYLFARFSYPTQRRAVESCHGIRGHRPFRRLPGNAFILIKSIIAVLICAQF